MVQNWSPPPTQFSVTPSTSPPAGFVLPRKAWNHLRIGIGKRSVLMSQWGFRDTAACHMQEDCTMVDFTMLFILYPLK